MGYDKAPIRAKITVRSMAEVCNVILKYEQQRINKKLPVEKEEERKI